MPHGRKEAFRNYIYAINYCLNYLAIEEKSYTHLDGDDNGRRYTPDTFRYSFLTASGLEIDNFLNERQQHAFWRFFDALWHQKHPYSFPTILASYSSLRRIQNYPPKSEDRFALAAVSKMLSFIDPRYPIWNNRKSSSILGLHPRHKHPEAPEFYYGALLKFYWSLETSEKEGKSYAQMLVDVGKACTPFLAETDPAIFTHEIVFPDRIMINIVLSHQADIPYFLQDNPEALEQWNTVRDLLGIKQQKRRA